MCACVCMCMCEGVCMCMCACVCVHVYVCMCMYVYVCAHVRSYDRYEWEKRTHTFIYMLLASTESKGHVHMPHTDSNVNM